MQAGMVIRVLHLRLTQYTSVSKALKTFSRAPIFSQQEQGS